MIEENLDKGIHNCTNCGSPVSGNYCVDCGQSTHAGRINLHYFIHEFQHSYLHVDKGIFYTLKELALHPGDMLRGYLDGKRVGHFKPFALVIILGTLYAFMVHWFNIYPEAEYMEAIPYYSGSMELNNKLVNLLYNNYSLWMLVSLPFYAFAFCLLFRKQHYNFWEYLVVASYLTGFQLAIMLVTYPFYIWLHLPWLHTVTTIFLYIYFLWALVQFFNNTSKLKVVLKGFCSLVLSFVFVGIVVFLIMTIIGLFVAFVLGGDPQTFLLGK